MSDESPQLTRNIPVIRLAEYDGKGEAWGRPFWVVAAWMLSEWLFVTNPLQISSRVRVAVLRSFGAEIGRNVIFRPRTRVKSPWKLTIGNDCWIGEGVWFHNQDRIILGRDCVISQDTFLTTGSHKVRDKMQLVTSPIHIKEGAWITARCVVTGGSIVGVSAVAKPMTVVRGVIPDNAIVGGPDCETVGQRFDLA